MYAISRLTPDDPSGVAFLDSLQSRNAHALGFLTWTALGEAIARGHVLRAWENGEPCGYLIHGRIKRETRILQTVVANDARRIQHATALVDALTTLANRAHGHVITLHCAEDLDANAFWKAVGFQQIGRRLKSKTGKRWQLRYEIRLPGEAEDRILQGKQLRDAGLERLHKLLVAGDVRLASVDWTRHRNHGHEILLP